MNKELIGFGLLGISGILLFLDALELGLNIPMDIVTMVLIPVGLFFVVT